MKNLSYFIVILIVGLLSNYSFSQTTDKNLNNPGIKVFASGNEAIPGDRNVIICLKLDATAETDRTVSLDFSGSTAVNGKDFVKLPDSVVVPKGEQYKCFVINPFNDNNDKNLKIIKFRAKTSESNYSDWVIKMRYTNKLEAYAEEEMNLNDD